MIKKILESLKPGSYFSDEKDGLQVNIKPHDDGLFLEILDIDADLFYSFVVSPSFKLNNVEIDFIKNSN